MEQVEKLAEKRHGSYRPGAGRKSKYGVKTVVMRIPENRVQEVENLISEGPVEIVTESKHETVTESVESVTESKLLDELKAELEEARKEIKFMARENSRLSQQLISANENAKAAEDLASKMEAQAADKGGKLERVQAELKTLYSLIETPAARSHSRGGHTFGGARSRAVRRRESSLRRNPRRRGARNLVACNVALMLGTQKARRTGLFEYPMGVLSQASGYLLLASL